MRSVRSFGLLLIAAMSLGLAGCVSNVPKAEKLSTINLGMTKQEVSTTLGPPTVARGSVRNKYGQVIDVWEYKLALPSDDSMGEIAGKSAMTFLTMGMAATEFKAETRDYWLYFLGNELVQWGQAGDWTREADRIYEFKFEPGLTTK